MGRTANAILVAAVTLILGALRSDSSRATRFAAKQAATTEAGSGAPLPKLVIREWDVPTPNSHPHDPAVAPDGALWYTGQMSNTLGRLDPKTSKTQEFQLKTPDSGPHGLVADHDGNICAITPDDRVYYSDYARGYLGVLDPTTGKTEEWPSPGGLASEPYAITATPDGKVWYAETGVAPNRIVGFDPQTQTFLTPTPIPSGGGVVRNMVATPDGKLYLAAAA